MYIVVVFNDFKSESTNVVSLYNIIGLVSISGDEVREYNYDHDDDPMFLINIFILNEFGNYEIITDGFKWSHVISTHDPRGMVVSRHVSSADGRYTPTVKDAIKIRELIRGWIT